MTTTALVPTLRLAAAALLMAWAPTFAAVTADEAARLRGELTPVGGERAGNKEGTIPAWSGGHSPKTPLIAGRRPDPYASDKVLFSITAENADKYAAQLSPGVLAMFKKYPTTYRIDVYPTRRSGAMSQEFYDATFKNATVAKVVVDPGNGRPRPEGVVTGTPFPIPKSGSEIVFNHMMSYWLPHRQIANNYLIQADGARILVSSYTNEMVRYASTPEGARDGRNQAVRTRTSNPPLRAGEAGVAHYYQDSTKDTVWVYLPGQRRVRKVPNSCCDTPTPFSAGLISFEEITGSFYGAQHKFDFSIVGKREMFVPYNTNRFLVPTKADDVIGKFHLNPDHVRWELHRVWVVEAKVKPGERHVSPRSTYYFDEDTWQGLLGDRYDAQGNLARTGFMLPVVLTDGPAVMPGSWGWYDLISGAAYIGNVFNESSEQLRVGLTFPDGIFTPEALAGEGVR